MLTDSVGQAFGMSSMRTVSKTKNAPENQRYYLIPAFAIGKCSLMRSITEKRRGFWGLRRAGNQKNHP